MDDFDFGTSPSIPNLGSVPDFNTRNTTDVQDPSGPLSLHAAISFGTVGDVSNILSLGASVDTWNSRGYQPLHGAVIKNDIALVKVLLRYRANVQSVGFESKTPIRLAASSMKILCLLLEKSPAVSQQDQAGNTVLHLLLQQEEWRTFPVNVSAIRTLLSCGADINVINNATESPLHLLVAQILPDSDEHLKLLLIFLNAIRTYLYQRLIDQLFSKRY